jgi:hypothetical protein
MNKVLFNEGKGNEEFANLPRKINVCISPSRDDFPHTQVCLPLPTGSTQHLLWLATGQTRSHTASVAHVAL